MINIRTPNILRLSYFKSAINTINHIRLKT